MNIDPAIISESIGRLGVAAILGVLVIWLLWKFFKMFDTVIEVVKKNTEALNKIESAVENSTRAMRSSNDVTNKIWEFLITQQRDK